MKYILTPEQEEQIRKAWNAGIGGPKSDKFLTKKNWKEMVKNDGWHQANTYRSNTIAYSLQSGEWK